MVQVEVRRQYSPDPERVIQALRRLLREPKPPETLPCAIPIRSPAVRQSCEPMPMEQG
jgi:hypothetical protein